MDRLVVVDIAPQYNSRLEMIKRHLNVLKTTDLYYIERLSNGTLSEMREILMDEWKKCIPVSVFGCLVDATRELVTLSPMIDQNYIRLHVTTSTQGRSLLNVFHCLQQP